MKKLLGVILAGMLVFSAVPMSAEASDISNDQNISSVEAAGSEAAGSEAADSEAVDSETDAAETDQDEDVSAENQTSQESAGSDESSATEQIAPAPAAETYDAPAQAATDAPAQSEPNVTVQNSTYQEAAPTPSVVYCGHVQNIGWQGEVSDGATAGTSGRSLRVEALKIHINGDSNLGVTYQAHVQDYGWMNWVSDGQVAGTSGQSKRVEAIRISLTGADAANYDIYYCAHVQNFGWMNWVKNGEMAGSSHHAYRVEAVKIILVAKGAAAPAKLGNADIGYAGASISYSTHVQNIGWMGAVSSGEIGGTTGRSLRMEALKIYKTGEAISGSINYRVHCQDYGWMGYVADGAMAGTSGQSKRLEALQISLTGDLATNYDIYYRTHVQDVGWTGWAVNGQKCGSQGFGRRMEAIQIALIPKGCPAPGSTANPFYRNIKSGIDVSQWQGNINWSQTGDAVDFAIIRCNAHSGSTYTGTDSKFFRNMSEAKKNQVPVGVYYYSVAMNTSDAVNEANQAVSLVRQAGGVNLPIFIDMEADNQKGLSNADRTAIVKAFCDTVRANGFQPGVYTNYYWFTHYLNFQELTSYTIWCAQYNTQCDLPYDYSFWQYTSKGHVPGINGNVDLDLRYM